MPEDQQKNSSELPTPEVLQPHSTAKKEASSDKKGADKSEKPDKVAKADKRFPKRSTYRPSHKATFIGLGVIAGILILNVAIFTFVIQSQSQEEDQVNREEVTLSSASLDELGVSRTPIGDLGTELTVGPDAIFRGSVAISGDTTIAGALTLNSSFTATDGNFAALQGGETSLTSLNVNQDTTTSNLNVREELVVDGAARFQGTVTASQLVTINNNLNVTGSLAVGGTLSVRTLAVSSLSIDTSLTLGGKIITRGAAPSVSAGPGVGSNGTVSISGTDTAGTVAVNVGTGGGNGTVAFITFRSAYGTTPKVVITPVGRSVGDFYINRSGAGFTIQVSNALSPGGYAFDYFVVQ